MQKTKLTLLLGFGGVMLLLLLLMAITLYQVNAAKRRIENVVLESLTKTGLITTMRTAARERTVSLQKMLIIDDSIETIDEWERFTYHGTNFIRAREAYLGMPLSAAEQNLVKQQADLVTQNGDLQVDVINLILLGKTTQARELLLHTVMPTQDTVFSFMTDMIRIQEEASADALQSARNSYQWTVVTMLGIAIAAVTVAFFIMRSIIINISQYERQLHLEKERALITLQSIGDAVITTDANGRIQQVNQRAELFTGVTAAQLIGSPLDETVQIVMEHAPDERVAPVSEVLLTQRSKQSHDDTILRRHDGSSMAIEYTAAPVMGSNKSIIGTVLTMHDVSEQRARSHELAQQARHDPLTGLLNRRELERSLQETLANIKRYRDETAWLCFLDLDRFKPINDQFGHLAGDEILKQVAAILRVHTRKTDHVARLGGDEFCIILRHCDKDMALAIMERIRKSLSDKPFRWENQSFRIGVSIGVTEITPQEADINAVIQKADSACYEVKHSGRNRVQLYPQVTG